MAVPQNIAHTLIKFLSYAKFRLGSSEQIIEVFERLVYPDRVDLAVVSDIADLQSIQEDLQSVASDLEGDQEEVLETLHVMMEQISDLGSIANTRIENLYPPLSDRIFWEEVGRYLPHQLLYEYLKLQHPKLVGVLVFLGLLTFENKQTKYLKKAPKFHFSSIGRLFEEPLEFFKDFYKWGTPKFEYFKLLDNLAFLTDKMGFEVELMDPRSHLIQPFYTGDEIPADLYELDINFHKGFVHHEHNSTWSKMGLVLFPVPNPTDEEIVSGLFLCNLLQGTFHGEIELSESNSILFHGEVESTGSYGFEIQPDTPIQNRSIASDIDFGIGFRSLPETPILLLGNKTGSRLELHGYEYTLSIEGSANAPELIFTIKALDKGLAVTVQSSNGDGFIKKVLENIDLNLEFPVGLQWSSKKGIKLLGAVGLAIKIQKDITLGPLTIYELLLALSYQNSQIKFSALTSIGLELGPFDLTLYNIGLDTVFSTAESFSFNSRVGNLGISQTFAPPNQIGISIETELIKGGGYLGVFPERHEYSGTAELTIKGLVSLKAVAIIQTRLPDNRDGYSFLLIITSEFIPIQLGFGFTLKGVGGLIGLHRSMDLEALRLGVREGNTNNILFPENPVEDAPQIIANLNAFFPAEQGQYAFGIMGKFGWGTKDLLEIELGLMLEVPEPIRLAILGILRLQVGTDNFSILKLQVNFLGTLDLEQKTIAFDASIFDSQLLTFDLSGDMAFRMTWGERPFFLLSAGGFHPAFEPPPIQLPTLRRMQLDIFKGDPRLSLSAYFALSSNTLQMGAVIDFYMTVSNKPKVYLTGQLGFNALFRFSPIYLSVDVFGNLSVMHKDNALLMISLEASLEGPTPWHIQGRATFKILGLKFSPSFNITTGRSDRSSLPPIEVLPQLIEHIEDSRNWQAILPIGFINQVSLQTIEQDNELYLHPLGALGFSQNLIPLAIHLDKVGSQSPSDFNEFDLAFKQKGSTALQDNFPAAQYMNLSKSQKLSRASYELFKSGIQTEEAEEIEFGIYTNKEVQYEVVAILDDKLHTDDHRDLRTGKFKSISTTRFSKWVNNGTVAQSSTGRRLPLKKKNKAKSVIIQEKKYVLVDNITLTPIEGYTAPTETAAYQSLRQMIKEHPYLEHYVQVLALDEIE